MKNQRADQLREATAGQPVPQLKVRSSLTAGAAPDQCLKKLQYWQDVYTQKCSTNNPR